MDAFSSLQVDSRNEDGALSGLPQKGLVTAALTGVGFDWCQSTGLVPKDEDATGVASSLLVDLSWCSESHPASNAEVLAYLLVALRVEVSLNEDVHLTLPGPVPVKKLSATCCYVGKMQLAVLLF